MVGSKVLVHKAHGCRAVTYGGRNPLDRAVAGVSRGEDTGYGGLERQGCAIERPPRRTRAVPHDVAPGQDVTALVALNRLG